jgi:hypothetical protein
MAILKFKQFRNVRNETKATKLKEKAEKAFKEAYYAKLESFGAKDASELNDDQLTQFLDELKTYRNQQS